MVRLFLTKISGNVASNLNNSVVDIFVSNNGCLPLRRCEDAKFLRDVFVLGYQCAMNVTLSQNGSAQKKICMFCDTSENYIQNRERIIKSKLLFVTMNSIKIIRSAGYGKIVAKLLF